MPALTEALSGLVGPTIQMLGFGLAIVILGIFAFVTYYIKKYNIPVDMEEQVGDGTIEYPTRAGIVTQARGNKEVKQLEVWASQYNPFKKIKGPVPTSDNWRRTSKGNRKLRLFKDGEESFKVIPPTRPSDVNSEPVDMDWIHWADLSLKTKAEKYRKDRGWWKENSHILGWGMVAVVMVFGIIYGMQGMGEISGNLAKMQEEQRKTAELVNDDVEAASGTQTVTQSEARDVPRQQGDQDGRNPARQFIEQGGS